MGKKRWEKQSKTEIILVFVVWVLNRKKEWMSK